MLTARSVLQWSFISIEYHRIWNFSTVNTILCKKVSSASFFATSGICNLEVLAVLLTKCIWWNKLWIHHRLSRSITSSSFCRLHFTRALATDLATTVFKTPPFFLTARRNLWTILLISPSKIGRPRFGAAIAFFRETFYLAASLIIASEIFLNNRTVLSPIAPCADWKSFVSKVHSKKICNWRESYWIWCATIRT